MRRKQSKLTTLLPVLSIFALFAGVRFPVQAENPSRDTAAGMEETLKLDPVFSSRMVLQQGKPIVFFGTAAPGMEVQVEFNGKTVFAEADPNGEWKTVFPAMKAGKTSCTATVHGGKTKIELEDILIGEVWFCSGQSNMEMPVGKWVQNWCTLNSEQEVAAANYPEIRLVAQKAIPSHNVPLPARYPGHFPRGRCWIDHVELREVK